MSDQLKELCVVVGKMSTEQAVTSEKLNRIDITMERMAESQEELVTLRAETVHILTAQADCKEDRDEIFTRLRAIEASPGCEACQVSGHVAALERNQRWAALLIIGSLAVAIIRKITTLPGVAGQ